MKYFTGLVMSAVFLLSACSQKINFASLEKIDAHFHLYTSDDTAVAFGKEHNFRFFSIVTRSDSRAKIDSLLGLVNNLKQKYPDDVFYATTFSMENFGEPGWQEETIRRLKRDFENGAIAVKVWKDIGMTFRDKDGSFIMIDDPRLDPILDFIAEQGKPLIAHIGEPKNCWLPLDSMTTNNDRSYFSRHPEYHMYLHPDYPSYDDQINARDHMLEKHPNLRVVGAHLGSLEWDVSEIAKRLDRFPNFAVDIAARDGQLQVQNRDKVRQFFIDYQDRILYGTDGSAHGSESPEHLEGMLKTWQRDWRYFATSDTLASSKVNNKFMGLNLPVPVLKKLYKENAEHWLGIKNE